MAIVLFTDFGSNDLYVGQVEIAILRVAPAARVVHLLHDAPAFAIDASAHLLAALAAQIPERSAVVAVVDPGVGSARRGVIVQADSRWFVGPDNGLLSVVAARSRVCRVWHLRETPQTASPTFHGRDVFAPLAAQLEAGSFPDHLLSASPCLDVELGGDDLARIIYFDHYGNAFSGVRGSTVSTGAGVCVAGRSLRFARTFAEVPTGEPFWYVNSQGLVEIAANSISARELLGLSLDMPLRIET